MTIQNFYLEYRELIKSNYKHFLALSLFFVFPISILLLSFPILQHIIINFKPLLFYLLYAFIFLALSICATATITYSFYHGYFDELVEIPQTLKSLSKSLIRLFATFICAHAIVLAGFAIVGLIVFAMVKTVEYIGLEINYSSDSFTVFNVIVSSVLMLVLFYIYLNWILAPVIVVVESSWGLEPLRRSAYLIKGLRGVGVCLLLYIALILWLVWRMGVEVKGMSFHSGILGRLMDIVLTVLVSVVLMACLFHVVAMNTFLCIKCKVLHGEIAGDYASLQQGIMPVFLTLMTMFLMLFLSSSLEW